ncbi:hypothetical protein NONI108955_44860 [Nocardia ninae]|uniref:Secreted protein n=2 Tax=Nocardia ninae TaxID=356145 RepID=A0A511MD30_9NOCA|nr:hypothetical protein NN4_29000 [Nocardia ninae NBRC 108245]
MRCLRIVGSVAAACAIALGGAVLNAPVHAAPQELCPLVKAACKCAQISLCTAHQNSEYVFLAEITGAPRPGKAADRVAYPVSVLQTLKSFDNATADVTTVETWENTAMCGDIFRPGRVYLIFGTGENGDSISTNQCSGNEDATDVETRKNLLKRLHDCPEGTGRPSEN